jgi:hypothetical protein
MSSHPNLIASPVEGAAAPGIVALHSLNNMFVMSNTIAHDPTPFRLGRKWRRKPLESLKTRPEMAAHFRALGSRAVQPQNRTASPEDGAVSSPSHITRRPRTIVPTGQPVTVFPS